VGFELMIPVFEQLKTICAFDHTAIGTSPYDFFPHQIHQNNVKHETSEFLGTEKGAVCKAKLMSLKQVVRINIRGMYRGIHEFQKGYQPRALQRVIMMI
jgi:hypothetical protein